MKTNFIDDRFSVLEAKNGSYSLRVTGEDGSVKTLHSLYDPEAEAEAVVKEFESDGKGIIVVLGLGLGYHIAALLRRFPYAEFLVVEQSAEIYEIAKLYGPSLAGKVKFIAGLSHDEALRDIYEQQMKKGVAPLYFFALSSAVSAFPSYYQPVIASLRKTVSVKLWERLRYPKFRNDVLNVLLVDSGYFLVQEAGKALKVLNHKVAKISVKRGESNDTVMTDLMEAIVSFRPDFILTINHLGFDEDGVITAFLRAIDMPAASWYVDSPRLIVQAFEKNVSPYVSMFLWDREYMEQMKESGFESVEYLPLAADDKVFKPLKLKQHILQKYQADVGFVGNSLYDSAKEKLAKVPERLHPSIDESAGRLQIKRGASDELTVTAEAEDLNKLTMQQRLDFEAAVLWKATLLYRMSCIEKMKDFKVHIHGDSGWKTLLGGSNILHTPLNYYKELPLFYNACRINFNATHLQMAQAVNQRVFDVPACGAFLLTDHQKSLDELFKVGEEIIAYKDIDEIPELVKYYLENSAARENISARGRERVIKEHTYKHRLNSLIQLMKKRFKDN